MKELRSLPSRSRTEIGGWYYSLQRKLKSQLRDRRGRAAIKHKGEELYFRSSDESDKAAIKFFEQNELETLDVVTSHINNGDVFYDIGANFGIYSCFASLYAGTTYAFEPHTPNLTRLDQHSRQEGVSVNIFDIALGNENTRGSVTSEDTHSKSGQIKVKPDGDGGVNVIMGDWLVNEQITKPPDLIKIDVEGAELEVIKGFEETLGSVNPILVIEIHEGESEGNSISEFGGSKAKLETILRKNGYNISTIIDRGSEKHILAK